MQSVRDQHLLFAKSHPNWTPSWMLGLEITYIRCLQMMFTTNDRCIAKDPESLANFQRMEKANLADDIKEFYKKDTVSQNLLDTIDGILGKGKQKWMFITLGYNDIKITPSAMRKVATQMSNSVMFTSVKFVHEKHRETGIHHHTHFLVETDLAKSTVLQKIYAFAGIKEYIVGKQFIDIKTNKDGFTFEGYEKYINGEKQLRKIPFVEQDRIWRSENNL